VLTVSDAKSQTMPNWLRRGLRTYLVSIRIGAILDLQCGGTVAK